MEDLQLNVSEAILNRRSIRKFTGKEIPQEILERILEAGRWAPSGSNAQPWRFVLVRDRIGKVKMFSPGLFDDPTALIVICSDHSNVEDRTGVNFGQYMDIGIAAQNMMLQAYELGIGSCPVRSFNQKAVHKLLGLPDDKIPELIVALGYPDEKPTAPPRRSLRETVSYEEYGR
jgi:nitroreductase